MIIFTEPYLSQPDVWRYQVYLDGQKLMRCYYADDAAGLARIFGETGESVELHGDVRLEIACQ